MASREKRPLAPSSKSKPKTSNDEALPALPTKTKKAKLTPYILEATGSKFPSPIDAALPRKKVLASLKCKKKLCAVKPNLIKVKSTTIVPPKNLKRLAAQTNKKAKINLPRIKKPRPPPKLIEGEPVPLPRTELSTPRGSPKTTRKLKLSPFVDPQKSAKLTRRAASIKEEIDADQKYLKNRKSSALNDVKPSRLRLDSLSSKSTVDSTIDDVLAMASDSELDYSVLSIDGKLTRRKKIDDKLLSDLEIKKEIIDGDFDGEELSSTDDLHGIIDIKQSKRKPGERSLRNGKLRQLNSSQVDELKKGRKSTIDETVTSEAIEDDPVDEAVNSKPPQDTNVSSVSLSLSSDSKPTDLVRTPESENNNNSGMSGIDEGPTLRSKSKTKSADSQIKTEEEGFYIIESLNDSQKPQSLGKCPLGKTLDKRRSSLNIDVKKTMGLMYGNEKADGTAPKSQIDQMIENIKLNIAKSIESKIFGPEKSLGLAKSFEPPTPRKEEIIAPASTETQKLDAAPPEILIDDDQPNESREISLQNSCNYVNNSCNSSINNNVDNSDDTVPKVADTAKEIEKLVMGSEIEEMNTVDDCTDSSSSRTDSVKLKDEVKSVPMVEEQVSIEIEKVAREADDNETSQMSVAPAAEEDSLVEMELQHDQPEVDSPTADVETFICAYPSADPSPEGGTNLEITDANIQNDNSEITEFLDEPSGMTSTLGATQEDLVFERSDSPQNTVEAALSPDDSEPIPSPSKSGEHVAPMYSVLECIPGKKQAVPDNEDGKRVLRGRDKLKRLERSEQPTTSKALEPDNVSMEGDPPNDPKELDQHDACPPAALPSATPMHRSPIDILIEAMTERYQRDRELSQESSKTTECKQEDGKRVLRARDKLRKSDQLDKLKTPEFIEPEVTFKAESEYVSLDDANGPQSDPAESAVTSDGIKIEEDYQGKARKGKEVKRRRADVFLLQNNYKTKKSRRETKKAEQNKEEILLDNEVAEINENNQEYSAEKFNKRLEGTESLRIFPERERSDLTAKNDRSKSENDIELCVHRLQGSALGRNRRNVEEVKEETPGQDSAGVTEIDDKDFQEISASGGSMDCVSMPKIIETPEDTAMKEKIFLMLGLESAEKAAERKKSKMEQCTVGLKTVIRVPKDSGKEKKRSRSPLKMVLKQGRVDGGGDSPEFYTIQKELGTSGVGDSSSGANRKFSTNHRQSCDEDPEETPSKEKQSLIIPEKSSSFSIHPGRLCADVCCYCFGKFGSLDTPMHLAQMKSDERKRKILSVERHLTKDSCLCDACYRHVDRKANTSPTNVSKPQRQHRQLMVSKCSAKDCRDPARHLVKRRWLLKIKSCLQNQLNIDWESSQHTSMSFCIAHYATIERFLTCALCKRRLVRNHTHLLPANEADELNRLLPRQGVTILLVSGTFVCKLCRYYTQLQLKYKDVENMNVSHRSFAKSYLKRILYNNNLDIADDDDDTPQHTPLKDNKYKDKETEKDKDRDKDKDQAKDKDRKSAKKSKYPNPLAKVNQSKSPESHGSPQKSTTEPQKSKLDESEGELGMTIGGSRSVPEQILDLESTVEKLKKRKALDQHLYSTDSPVFADDNSVNVVEILAMDKEVTLTRLPKKQKLGTCSQGQSSNDISPVVQRLGANPSISVRTLFPGEEEMGLHATLEFSNIREITPQGWEKCATIIQYDRDTKLLWQELQRPYGNQSSFLRHLILLEKYYRSGDLVLAPNASRNAINYSTSVQNRLISYEGPEKMDEPITEPMPTEFHHAKRLSGGYLVERDRNSLPGNISIGTPVTPLATSVTTIASTPLKAPVNTPTKASPSKLLKLNQGVSITKKPPPNLQRLNLPSSSSSSSSTSANGSIKRKEAFPNKIAGTGTSGGKVFQLTEPDFKRLQSLKKQKMMNEKVNTPSNPKLNSVQLQKAQLAAQTQFQKHLRMQQEMLSRQSRGDFEPLICDVRSLANENTPAQNLLNNLNLPKSIQVTTKSSNSPIPILPKIPKSLTVIPQTVPRNVDK